ncbi:Hsp20/alpha crystallin [Mactra antiquata]
MAQRIPIFKDDLSFAERQSRVWGDMERDLERRRREWEDEIERMRKDFFTLKPDDTGRMESISDKFKMGDSLKDEARGVVEQDENGRPVFRVRFNVNTYKPEEVNVKIDTTKLIVHAKHEEKSDNKSVSREYSREVDLPRDIDAMALQCSISTDGILTVEAPMPTPQYGAIKDSGGSRTPPKEHVIQTSSTSSVSSGARNTPPPPVIPQQQQGLQSQQQQQQNQQKHSSTFTTFLSGSSGGAQPQQQPKFQPPPPLVNQQTVPPPSMSSPQQSSSSFSALQESDRKFKVDVDIEDFAPEELSVKTVDRKLVISAKREEKLGNRTSTKELNREIYLPDTVDPYSVKAFFSDSGKLIVEAPYIRSVPISHYSDGIPNMAGR